MLAKIKKFLLHHELLVIILCLVAIFRLPSLLEPYWYGDEGIYLTLGNGIRHGLTLYRDIHDNKPPGIYILAAIAGSLFWFKFILLTWNLASIAVFHWIANKILNPDHKSPIWKIKKISFPVPTLATFSTFLFAFLPFAAEGSIANGEIFMILPTLVGMALLLKLRMQKQVAKNQTLQICVLAGFSFSLAFLIKVPAIFDAIAAGIFFFLIPTDTIASVKGRFIAFLRSIFSLPAWVYGFAFVLPIVFSIVYYTAVGAGQPYLKAALLQNVNYLSSWTTGTQSSASLGQTGLKNRAIIVGVISLTLLLGSSLITQEATFVLIWFAFALFGALLSERPYPHYLIQVIPALALLLPLFIKTAMELKRKHSHRIEYTKRAMALLALGGCIAALIISFVAFKFWNYSIPPYYQNYVKFVTGKISREQYFSYFDPTLSEQYSLAHTIMMGSDKNDRIFIWGDLPNIYALTRRLPPGKYTSAYHVKDFNGFDETLVAIYEKNPKFILIDKRIEMFPNLRPLLLEEYAVVYESQNFTLYRRLESVKSAILSP